MKRLGIKILGSIVAVIILLQTNMYVIAVESTSDLKDQQSAINNEKKEAEDDLKEVQAQKSETVKQVEELSTQISNYETQIEELNGQISTLNTKIEESEKKLKKAQEDYTKQEKLLEDRLVATYEAGETSYLDFILSSESITDLISNYYLVTELATNDTELLEKIQKQKQEIEQAKKELEANKQQLATSKASKQGITTQLQTAKNEKNQQVAQLSEDEQKLQQRIEELRQANQSIDSKIKAAQAAIEAARKQQLQQQKQQQLQQQNSGGASSGSASSGTTSSSNANPTGTTGSKGFIYPVPSGYTAITTGMYYSSGSYHGAIDFGSGGINGQPVYAVADGYVVTSERLNGSYGNYILIAHYNGLYTLYAHGQDGSRTVSAGQTVKQGQQIMRVGSTGNSSGPHLHFEVRLSPGLYSNRVNPTAYL